MNGFVKIGTRQVGRSRPVFVIAEIGSNHDGSLDKAKELIKASARAGADAVKIQSFTAEGLLNPLKPNGDGTWEPHPAYPVIEKLAVPEQWHRELKRCAEDEGVEFLSAPFDPGRAELLNDLGVEAFKVASGDLTNEPLLKKLAGFKKPVILSTGASYMNEVSEAVEVLEAGGAKVALLHCASLYPPSYEDVNLKCVATLEAEFGCPVGLSDHTPGRTMPVAAVALGASIIEKHITLDKTSEGPDHAYAMEPDEFSEMVAEIRKTEAALGDGVKRPSRSEMGERTGARRSIYATTDIHRGETITEDKLKVVRHAYGLGPAELSQVVGKTAARDLAKDHPLTREDLCL